MSTIVAVIVAFFGGWVGIKLYQIAKIIYDYNKEIEQETSARTVKPAESSTSDSTSKPNSTSHDDSKKDFEANLEKLDRKFIWEDDICTTPLDYRSLLITCSVNKFHHELQWVANICDILYDQHGTLRDEFELISELLKDFEAPNLDEIYAALKKTLEIYSKNQNDATEYLNSIFQARSTPIEKLRDKYNRPLADLVSDNARIIDGLKNFENSLRGYFAELYHDKNPAHLTDFTSLETLQKISEHINSAVESAKTEKTRIMPKPEERPTPNVPVLRVPTFADYEPMPQTVSSAPSNTEIAIHQRIAH